LAPEEFHSIIPPGLLLGFSAIDWKGGTRGNQVGHGRCTASLVFRLPAATYAATNGADGPLTEYEDFELLSEQLHQVASELRPIGDRVGSRDYFTGNFYVTEQTYEYRIYHDKPVTVICKPKPDIKGSIQSTITIHT
jgi:hypothetical protein